MSKKIYAKHVSQIDPGPRSDLKTLKPGIDRFKEELITVAEKVAGVKFNDRNWFLAAARAKYPETQVLHYVDRHFPRAIGGALMVDEPRTEEQISLCELKGEKLWRLGYRYCYVAPDMDVTAVMMQLERYGNALVNRNR